MSRMPRPTASPGIESGRMNASSTKAAQRFRCSRTKTQAAGTPTMTQTMSVIRASPRLLTIVSPYSSRTLTSHCVVSPDLMPRKALTVKAVMTIWITGTIKNRSVSPVRAASKQTAPLKDFFADIVCSCS